MLETYCYVCRRRDGADDVLIVDPDEGEYRHPECSLSNAASRLPVTRDDLKHGIHAAEECLLDPGAWADAYREAWTVMRRAAMLALDDLQRMDVPPVRTVDQVLAAIVAEGHISVSLDHHGWSGEGRWQCSTHLESSLRGTQESWEDYSFRSHRGEARGATALEAVTNRLEFIQAGKGLAALVGMFVSPVEVMVRDQIEEA